MQVVNGYFCQDCTDVARAKKGIDPAHPEQGPHALKPKSATDSDPAPALATSGDVGTRLHVIA